MSTTSPRLAALAAAALAGVGCAGQQLRSYSFDAVQPQEKAIAAIAEALAEVGRPPAMVDARAGVVVTAWSDSGYRFHEAPPFPDDLNGDIEKYIFRRYHVAVVPGSSPAVASVRVQAEVKRCLPPITVVEEQLVGQCEESLPAFRSLQRDLDRLGEALQAVAFAAPARAGKP
jgi:hypothetical protein